MTLEQPMAFTVNPDHARQEQVWDAVQRGYDKGAHAIRRMLTEATVRASDKRVRFVGLDAYEEAGGVVLRDLFQSDDGGWLTDGGLLDMLVAEKLRDEADAVRAEGWRWVEVAPDLPYGHTFGLRGIVGERAELTVEEQAARDALVAEQEQIESEYYNAELPDEIGRSVVRNLADVDPVGEQPRERSLGGQDTTDCAAMAIPPLPRARTGVSQFFDKGGQRNLACFVEQQVVAAGASYPTKYRSINRNRSGRTLQRLAPFRRDQDSEYPTENCMMRVAAFSLAIARPACDKRAPYNFGAIASSSRSRFALVRGFLYLAHRMRTTRPRCRDA